MKKIIFTLATFFTCCTVASAQQATLAGAVNSKLDNNSIRFATNGQRFSLPAPDDDRGYDFYKKRARTQRIIGLSLLGVGLISGGIGLLEATKEVDYTDYAASDRADRAAVTAFVISGVTGIASIPFMVLAHASNHKAKVMLKSQKTGLGVPANVSKDYAALSITIPIGK